jgi:hypothetical protein
MRTSTPSLSQAFTRSSMRLHRDIFILTADDHAPVRCRADIQVRIRGFPDEIAVSPQALGLGAWHTPRCSCADDLPWERRLPVRSPLQRREPWLRVRCRRQSPSPLCAGGRKKAAPIGDGAVSRPIVSAVGSTSAAPPDSKAASRSRPRRPSAARETPTADGAPLTAFGRIQLIGGEIQGAARSESAWNEQALDDVRQIGDGPIRPQPRSERGRRRVLRSGE